MINADPEETRLAGYLLFDLASQLFPLSNELYFLKKTMLGKFLFSRKLQICQIDVAVMNDQM